MLLANCNSFCCYECKFILDFLNNTLRLVSKILWIRERFRVSLGVLTLRISQIGLEFFVSVINNGARRTS